jgi:hypothetical protein
MPGKNGSIRRQAKKLDGDRFLIWDRAKKLILTPHIAQPQGSGAPVKGKEP